MVANSHFSEYIRLNCSSLFFLFLVKFIAITKNRYKKVFQKYTTYKRGHPKKPSSKRFSKDYIDNSTRLKHLDPFKKFLTIKDVTLITLCQNLQIISNSFHSR